MGDINVKYGSKTDFTLTTASLADGSARETTAIANTTPLYVDALVQGKVKLAAGTPAGDKAVYVYAYGTADPGTPKYPDNVTGSDAAITLDDPTQLRMLGQISTPAGATEYVGPPMSVAQAFGGHLPEKWGLVIVNESGLALSSTEADCGFWYQGIEYQAA